jgi:DNA replication protein DnaC
MKETLEETLERVRSMRINPAKIVTNEEAESHEHKSKVRDLMEKWNAPRRHLQNSNKVDRSGEWGKTESWIKSQIGKGYFIALIGKRGPGKTQLAVEAMIHHTQNLRTARYITATSFLMRVKGTYKPSEREDEDDVLTMFARPSLLVIDEYAKRGETEWEDRLLFELLDRRYGEYRDTILIANQTKEEFEQSIGPSLASRMDESGGIIECTWESFRISP